LPVRFDGTLETRPVGQPATGTASAPPAIEAAGAGGRQTSIAVVVGTGRGRSLLGWIATAKGLAHGLGCPIVGVSTGLALLAAAPRAHCCCPRTRRPRVGPCRRAVAAAARWHRAELRSGERLVAVDLDGRALETPLKAAASPDELAEALLRLGAERLAEHRGDDSRRSSPST
jgi:hypothetical protein